MRVDINADVGESVHGPGASVDHALIPYVTSINIACGLHAGGPVLMRDTIDVAIRHGVAIGGHPSFDDRDGFGRRELRLPLEDVEAMVLYQIGALAAVASARGARVSHVKPHGALYNMAARDSTLAETVARAVRLVDRSLILVGLAGSASIAAAERLGLRSAGEAFADRAYHPDGRLVPRTEPGAVIHDTGEVVARALRMIGDGVIVTTTGAQLKVRVDTLCVHSDTPDAASTAAALRTALTGAGVTVRAFSE